MTSKLVDSHLNRIKTAVLRRYSAASIAKWICEHTKYAGEPYSYHDHEYQERILNDTCRAVVIRKCSQVGISEAAGRMALALVNVLTPYTVAYTLPTASFAATFARTRIDPVIEGSKEMKEAVHTSNNNSEVKQFADSFLFIRGAASSNAPISIPVDHLIHDEVDFSDQEVLGQYQSRLTHSKWKREHLISTPTVPHYGIDKAFKQSRRHFLFVKCCHCNHHFVPNYYDHVRVPDYTGSLRGMTKQLLAKIRFEEAYVACPKCGKEPSLQPEHREWVCENPGEFVAAGYQVSPFDAPNIIKPGYLVQQSTKYDRIQDFENFNLGLPSDDREATLTREDMVPLFELFEIPRHVQYVMGVDVGSTYYFCVAAIDGYGDMQVVHTEKCAMGSAKTKYRELRQRFHVICTVIDSGPHAETVMSLQEEDPNCYAAVYMRSKSILTHTVIDKEEEADKGKEFVRQVNINRNRALDAYMNYLRENHLKIRKSADEEEIIAHHTSMKRVKIYESESGELAYNWQKTDGFDHFHHTFLYAYIAGKMKGVSRFIVPLPAYTVHKIRLKGAVSQR